MPLTIAWVTGIISLAISTVVTAQTMATTAVWHPAQVSLYHDTFSILMNGQSRGTHSFAMTADGHGFRYTEDFSMDGLGRRTLEVALDTTLRPIRSHSEGHAFGQPMGSDLVYNGRTVKGRALVRLGTAPAREVAIDRALSPGTIDGLALMGLLPTLEWKPGVTYAISLFDPDEDRETTQRLSITGPEHLSVPAGTFATYRADLTTTQAPVRI